MKGGRRFFHSYIMAGIAVENMKHWMLTVIVSLILFSGCSILMWPIKLFTEILPSLIQYAPYALLFVEATDSVHPDLATKQFEKDLQEWSIRDKNIDDSISSLLTTKVQQQNKLQFVVAVRLDSEEKLSQVYQWIAEKQNIYKITAMVATYSIVDDEQLANILNRSKKQFTFIADGSMSMFSDQNCEQWLQHSSKSFNNKSIELDY